jgi:hypothetical protein
MVVRGDLMGERGYLHGKRGECMITEEVKV